MDKDLTNEILKGVNKEQAEAITYQDGPLLIIAGAGTGKTTVISRRIAWLVGSGLAKMDEILALTFTDKAAGEMTERVDILLPYGYTDVWISTFHAFGDRVLRESALELGLNPDFQVLTKPEAAIFFKEHLFEFPLKIYRPLSNPTKFIDTILVLFSRLRDEDISPKEYLDYAKKLGDKAKDEAEIENAKKHLEVALTYEKYTELLDKEGKVDFANQFYLALKILRAHPSILKRYQNQFKYILVDEFQDTNYAQFQLLKLLAAGHKNISVVSDDDQCIFRFRGAAYSNILNFIKEYPKAKQISLIQNYRSTQVILDTAYTLIQNNNPERFEVKAGINKKLIGISPKGKKVEHLHYGTVSDEADGVAEIIQGKVKKGEYEYGDFAVLVRSNNDADPFLRSLNMKGIPWRFSGNQGLYSREEVRMCISFLRVINNLNDSINLYYLASSEIYKIPLDDLSFCMHYSKRTNYSLYFVFKSIETIKELECVTDKSRKIIHRIVKDLEDYLEYSRISTTGRLLYKFLTDSNYLKNLVKEETLGSEQKIENLAKFFDMVRKFEYVAREDRLIYFINHLDMLIDAGDDPATAEADFDESAVNVLTIHKAKGLEFPVVFLVSLVKGKFPWPKRGQAISFPEELIKDIPPVGDFHIQEERRLFYVGMTRAKKELYFTSAADYGTTRMREISTFIFEALGISKENIKALKSSAKEAIERFSPVKESAQSKKKEIPADEILDLSAYKLDDYLTCPLKYKYVHILRIPILEHHTVLYGSAIHEAVENYYKHKMLKEKVSLEQVVSWFEDTLRPHGFLTMEHFKERLEHGKKMLEEFYKREEKLNIIPDFIEKEFSFMVDNNRIKGRWDRIDTQDGEAVIVDFKSSSVDSQKEADKKAKDNQQLSVYALAYKETQGKLPKRVELYFVESGIVGCAEKDDDDFDKLHSNIETVSQGIRKQDFKPKPNYNACSNCAFNQICPHTAYK
ncbi:MAG: ATP-dependent DNA helicase [Candidatus Omnitrophica bacterium]|nr:ATP-dependent DNA helicase [Candidatus Omnitrophota bacterium]MDD5352001.1 ATP-dependent DNA helicase [Candidatus Omnitrophota bacterium]MDD5551055.1 ATP-dependent DNA helicase [Candidatus Omnitrophota bacterium]